MIADINHKTMTCNALKTLSEIIRTHLTRNIRNVLTTQEATKYGALKAAISAAKLSGVECDNGLARSACLMICFNSSWLTIKYFKYLSLKYVTLIISSQNVCVLCPRPIRWNQAGNSHSIRSHSLTRRNLCTRKKTNTKYQLRGINYLINRRMGTRCMRAICINRNITAMAQRMHAKRGALSIKCYHKQMRSKTSANKLPYFSPETRSATSERMPHSCILRDIERQECRKIQKVRAELT